MNVRSSLAAVAVVCSVYFGAVPGAAGVSLSEYDRMTDVEQDRLMFTLLHFYYYRFADNPETAGKATCMRDMNERTGEGGQPYLASQISRELDSARGSSGTASTVEGVVKDVIDRECEAS